MVPTDTDALYPYSTRAYGVVESAVAPIAVTGSTVTTISSASSRLQSLFFIVPSFHFIILKFCAFIFLLFTPSRPYGLWAAGGEFTWRGCSLSR